MYAVFNGVSKISFEREGSGACSPEKIFKNGGIWWVLESFLGLAICTGLPQITILDYNLVRFGVSMIKLRHERMLILRCILPPKN